MISFRFFVIVGKGTQDNHGLEGQVSVIRIIKVCVYLNFYFRRKRLGTISAHAEDFFTSRLSDYISLCLLLDLSNKACIPYQNLDNEN